MSVVLSWTNGTKFEFSVKKETESFELLSCVCLGRKVGLAQNPFYHTTNVVTESTKYEIGINRVNKIFAEVLFRKHDLFNLNDIS